MQLSFASEVPDQALAIASPRSANSVTSPPKVKSRSRQCPAQAHRDTPRRTRCSKGTSLGAYKPDRHDSENLGRIVRGRGVISPGSRCRRKVAPLGRLPQDDCDCVDRKVGSLLPGSVHSKNRSHSLMPTTPCPLGKVFSRTSEIGREAVIGLGVGRSGLQAPPTSIAMFWRYS